MEDKRLKANSYLPLALRVRARAQQSANQIAGASRVCTRTDENYQETARHDESLRIDAGETDHAVSIIDDDYYLTLDNIGRQVKTDAMLGRTPKWDRTSKDGRQVRTQSDIL
uniref:Uncharacterized protein n=1 Tax=Romanomermis culicivorax TaxID=13658 RepID=A0A915IUL7_ROMCU